MLNQTVRRKQFHSLSDQIKSFFYLYHVCWKCCDRSPAKITISAKQLNPKEMNVTQRPPSPSHFFFRHGKHPLFYYTYVTKLILCNYSHLFTSICRTGLFNNLRISTCLIHDLSVRQFTNLWRYITLLQIHNELRINIRIAYIACLKR